MKFSTEPLRPTVAALAALVAMASVLPACASADKRVRSEKRSASHLAFASRLLEQGRSQEALGHVEQALKEWKKNPDAWLARGQVHFSLGDYATAIGDFTTAMKHRSGFTEALSWRGWAYIEAGDLGAAEKDYRQALLDRTYPTPEKVHLNLALLLLRTNRETEAIAELKEAVRMNPAYTRGHYELGKILDRNANLSGAIVAYEAALGGMKDSADLNLRLGIVLEKTGEGGRAREYYRRVIEIDPKGPEAVTARDHLRKLESPS